MPAEEEKSLNGTKIKAVPKPKKEIGIDTEGKFADTIMAASTNNVLDMNALESFTNVSQSRESVYSTIDAMAQDSTLASVLETYAEDTVETNDKGQVVWCESSDPKCNEYVSFLLDTLNIDKHIYEWAHSLIKYGDLYVRLYKASEYKGSSIFGTGSDTLNEAKEQNLVEKVNLKLNKKKDRYVHYVEANRNPGEMFELTQYGKTMGYIKAPLSVQTSFNATSSSPASNAYDLMKYKMKQNEVNVYEATSFVHACLEDNSSRTPEEVSLILETAKEKDLRLNGSKHDDGLIHFDDLDDADEPVKEEIETYQVKRGQSLLYNVFKIWREMTLLEDSVLLNRLTQSSFVRLVQIEVGDMPKEKVQLTLAKFKELLEQKTSIAAGTGMSEYNNPSPVVNNIYVPTHDGDGAITVTSLGGDVDPKQLTDLDWFNNKLFGALRIPKQYFGFTDDGAGFNGGQSLTILSSRYGKAIKRIQNTLCQMITDIVNLFLLDRGLTRYINKFIIRMQAPLTQEEIDRRQNNDNRIRYVSDIMNQCTDLPDTSAKLKILKSLLTSVVKDSDIIDTLQDQISKLEEEGNENPKSGDNENKETPSIEDNNNEGPVLDLKEPEVPENNEPKEQGEEEVVVTNEPTDKEDSYLPSPSELNIDMTNNQ